MILLTAAKMPDGLDKSILADAVGLMFSNPENKEYFEKIRKRDSESSACESLFALALLYEQICNLPCPVDASTLVFEQGECGKPYFKDSDVKFNVSHSKSYVACAVSLGEELGIDMEAAEVSRERAEKLAKRYFCEEEQNEVLKNHEIFARKWTEKESRAKFFGESIGNILYNDKIRAKNSFFDQIVLHKFSFDNIPITLCTKRDFSTIIFTVQ